MKKMSFEDIAEKIAAEKHNSDLQNLAIALNNVAQHRIHLNSLEAQLRAVVTRIEDGEEIDVSVIKKLYDQTFSPVVR